MTKVLFMGRKKVGAQCLEYLLSQSHIQVVGVLTDSHLAVSPVSEVAKAHGVPILQYADVLQQANAGELAFDLGLSMLYWRKLKGKLVSGGRLGTVNFHPAPLPEYKGTAGYNLAILEGLSQWAVTAHYVDEKIDTGEIIEVASFPIDRERETTQSLEATTQPLLFQLFVRTVEKIIAVGEKLDTIPNQGGRYISRAEMEAMKEVKEGDDVSRKIRAFWFPPYDGAYQIVNGVKCTLIDRFILSKLGDPTASSLFTDESAS